MSCYDYGQPHEWKIKPFGLECRCGWFIDMDRPATEAEREREQADSNAWAEALAQISALN